MIEGLLPPKELPPRAREHCRHYSYQLGWNGGPQCARGVDMAAAGAALPCMPPDYQRGVTCPKREEWSAAERATWQEFSANSIARAAVIMQAIPDTGEAGRIACPVCGGKVSWSRARSNGHLHAACSTPHCFAVMQ
jgi:hypothetical protein